VVLKNQRNNQKIGLELPIYLKHFKNTKLAIILFLRNWVLRTKNSGLFAFEKKKKNSKILEP